MMDPDKIRKQVNGINVDNTLDAIASLKLHLAELATICFHQGAAITELQEKVKELQARPQVKSKPF